ncbi:MAG: hypothetical protein K2R98_19350 [Gemmataceae bacterium]|nr:hypothetical protein [Gemmataceae bacterium]
MKTKKNATVKPMVKVPYQANELVSAMMAEQRKSVAEYVQAAEKALSKKAQAIRQTVDAVNLLNAHGFNVKLSKWEREDFTLEVERDQLAAVYAAIGPIKPDHKSLSNARARTVNVYLKSVNYPTVTVRYTTKLPKTAKCKVVRRRSSYSSLVCNL